jgi:hypothetical protein
MGVTRNISNSGVFILANECPAAGALIQMTIALPMRSGANFRLKLHGEGVALRGECGERLLSGSKLFEFAASVQFYPEQASQTFAGQGDDSNMSRPKWHREREQRSQNYTGRQSAE